MKLYTESSAVFAWLLEQEHGELVADTLADAELIVSSDLTLIEMRSGADPRGLNELQESDAAHRQARFNAVATRWTLLALDEEIIEVDLAMLSLDGRVRKSCRPSRLSTLAGRRRTYVIGAMRTRQRMRCNQSRRTRFGNQDIRLRVLEGRLPFSCPLTATTCGKLPPTSAQSEGSHALDVPAFETQSAVRSKSSQNAANFVFSAC